MIYCNEEVLCSSFISCPYRNSKEVGNVCEVLWILNLPLRADSGNCSPPFPFQASGTAPAADSWPGPHQAHQTFGIWTTSLWVCIGCHWEVTQNPRNIGKKTFIMYHLALWNLEPWDGITYWVKLQLKGTQLFRWKQTSTLLISILITILFKMWTC